MMDSWRDVPGWWEGEDFCRREVMSCRRAAHFVEVGSWRGRSAACMATAIQRLAGLPIRFDQIDTWQGSDYGEHRAIIEREGIDLREEFERNLRALGLWRYVNPIRSDSLAAAGLYEDGSLDLVMLDSDHRVEHVRQELRAWLPKVRPGGILSGHDAQNPGVEQALSEVLTSGWEVIGDVWRYQRPGYIDPWAGYVLEHGPVLVQYPPSFPGCQEIHGHLLEGFKQLGFNGDVRLQYPDDLLTEGCWCPPGKLGEPIHVANLNVGGVPVYYDASDFPLEFSDILGLPYLKIQAPAEPLSVEPIGQYVGPAESLRALLEFPHRRQPETAYRYRALACFSNIDERNNEPRRRRLVEMLRGCDGVMAGLWRYSKDRPEVAPHLLQRKHEQADWWGYVQSAGMVFALPGVGGDFTRLHAEVMALGSCLVTVKTEQRWPGNWRGCWAEIERDLSDAMETFARLDADPDERDRLAHLGHWYWCRNLHPVAAARRVLSIAWRHSCRMEAEG